MKRSLDVLLDEDLPEGFFVVDFFEGFLDGVSVVEEHEADANGKVVHGISEVAQLLGSVEDISEFDPFFDEKGRLVEVSVFQANAQGSVVLVVCRVNVDALVQEVQNREEVVLFTGVV